MSVREHLKSIRSLGRVVSAVADVDVPKITVDEDLIIENPDDWDWIPLHVDDEWESAVRNIVAIYETEFETVEWDEKLRVLNPNESEPIWETEISIRTDWVASWTTVDTLGFKLHLSEYQTANRNDTLFEGDLSPKNLDQFEIAFEIASTELAILANDTGSCAATLDYWQTELSPQAYQQHEWANIRGVNRQTVNDRIREVKRILD